jgi:predicted alpha/beta-hydrolase family hydrolase
LHTDGKPAVARAAHLPKITQPMLFLSGTRDALADAQLLREQVAALGKRAQLHWLHDADHSYAVRKRERGGYPDVFEEIGASVAAWLTAQAA